MDRDEESVIAGSEPNAMMVANVPHRSHNVCGVLLDSMIITAPADDSIQRDLAIYELYNQKDHNSTYYGLFVRVEAKKKQACASFLAHLEVLNNAEGDVHLPQLIAAKPLRKLYFGMDNIQQGEHDADWKRPAIIVKMPAHCVFLVSLRTLSPTGNVDTSLALAAGLGMVNALNALHTKGFISRYVTPWNLMVPVPFSMDNIRNRMVIMDLSLAKRWNSNTARDVSVRFAGTVKYSSQRALGHRSVGPADDFISAIYIVAELISGKLPWRSSSKIDKCFALRQKFTESIIFRRLPREIRKLYFALCKFTPADRPSLGDIAGAFEAALKRRYGSLWSLLTVPYWLEMPNE